MIRVRFYIQEVDKCRIHMPNPTILYVYKGQEDEILAIEGSNELDVDVIVGKQP